MAQISRDGGNGMESSCLGSRHLCLAIDSLLHQGDPRPRGRKRSNTQASRLIPYETGDSLPLTVIQVVACFTVIVCVAHFVNCNMSKYSDSVIFLMYPTFCLIFNMSVTQTSFRSMFVNKQVQKQQ